MSIYRCHDPEADWIADQETDALLLQAERALWRHRQAFARIAANVDGERARLIAQEALRDEETRAVVAALRLARTAL